MFRFTIWLFSPWMQWTSVAFLVCFRWCKLVPESSNGEAVLVVETHCKSQAPYEQHKWRWNRTSLFQFPVKKSMFALTKRRALFRHFKTVQWKRIFLFDLFCNDAPNCNYDTLKRTYKKLEHTIHPDKCLNNTGVSKKGCRPFLALYISLMWNVSNAWRLIKLKPSSSSMLNRPKKNTSLLSTFRTQSGGIKSWLQIKKRRNRKRNGWWEATVKW